MMSHWDGDWGVGNWLLVGLGMLLFWALVVAGIVLLVRSLGNRPMTAAHGIYRAKSAGFAGPPMRDIVAERDAHGESGDDQYRARHETRTEP